MGLLNIPFETMGLSKYTRLWRYVHSLLRHSTPRKLLNLLSIETQMMMKRERVAGAPYILKIESTNICNFRCPVCYEHRKSHDFEGGRGYGRMELSDFKKVIDELHPLLYRINLYGFGEPFLFDEVFGMIRYASDHNIGVAITSNFNRIDGVKVDKIIDSGLEQLAISIDGVDQASYERYQVGGNFEKLMENIRMLQNRKKERNSRYPIVDWQFLIMKHNSHMRDQAARMAADLGIGIRFSRIGVDFTDDRQCDEWLPDVETRKELNFEDQMMVSADRVPLCSWLYRMAFINWDMGVSPCCNYYTGDKSHDFGSLKNSRFSEIWNNRHYVDARRASISKGRDRADRANVCVLCLLKREQIRRHLGQAGISLSN